MPSIAVGRMMNGPMDDRVKTMSSGGHVHFTCGHGWMDGCKETGQQAEAKSAKNVVGVISIT